MLCKIVYDPQVDIQEVDQFGFVDLVSAMTNGVVDPSFSTDNLDFDGDVENADFVGRRIQNSFDAIDNQNRLADVADKNNA